MKGVYYFKPNDKRCNLSVYEKYPDLCIAIGLGHKLQEVINKKLLVGR